MEIQKEHEHLRGIGLICIKKEYKEKGEKVVTIVKRINKSELELKAY